MKSAKRLLFLCLICFKIIAQDEVLVQGFVKDTKGHPIQYAIITNTKFLRGKYSDSLGSFSLKLASTDVLRISSLGYEEVLISVRDFAKNKIIYLKESPILLNDVTITQGNKTKRLGVLNKKSNTEIFVNVSGNVEFCLLINNPDKLEGILNKVSYYINHEGKYLAPFRVRIYSLTDNGMPYKDLLMQNIIIDSEGNNKWLDVDLAGKNIAFPENGIAIGMEWINVGKDKNLTAKYREQKIGAVKGKSFDHCIRVNQGEWFKMDIPLTPMMRCEVLKN